ncbi:MAG: ABC transporter ATP-binding protein [Desulfovibrio sp.]|nr:ABC transporter ATP-binding protein [Desulfovibrio sp.]
MLEIHSLFCGYGSRVVLRDVSLSILPGEFAVLLGTNGCGKTTLLRAITHALAVVRGTISWQGKNLLTMGWKQRARLCAYVPQTSLIPQGVTVWDFVFLGRYPHRTLWGFTQDRDREIVWQALCETQTIALKDRLVTELSGGERKRVLLALALAQESPLLLLDEVSAGLDCQALFALFGILKARTRKGQTVLCVMHDYNIARFYADRLIGFAKGGVCFNAPTNEAFTEANLSTLYAIPITIATLESSREGSTIPFAYPTCLSASS